MGELMVEMTGQDRWGYDYDIAVCHDCDGCYLVEKELMPQRCPICFKEMLVTVNVEMNSSLNIAPPEFVLPFKLSHNAIFQVLEEFGRGFPFPPVDLTPDHLVDRLHRLYLPIWLVDTLVSATWEMQAGFQYQVVSHQDQYDDRRRGWVTREVNETRVRWEPRLGQLRREYQNIPAPALEETNLSRGMLISNHPESWQAYQPDLTSRTLVRLPQRGIEDAWNDIQPHVQGIARDECQVAAEADEVRDFQWSPEFDQQEWTLLLQPVYSTYYVDDNGQPCPILLDGINGKVMGKKVASSQRAKNTSWIIIAIAVCIALMSVLIGILGIIMPVLLPLGLLGLVVAVFVGGGALLPPVIAWQFNRSQEIT